MKLTKEEKELLRSVKSHPGWALMEKLAKEAENALAVSILTKYDLENEEDRKKIRELKIYNEARLDFIKDVERSTRETIEATM